MNRELLDILAEPGTGAPLVLENEAEKDGRIESGELVSTTSGKRYPIVRGVPRFVGEKVYADSFGLQWNRFREVQIDSHTGARTSHRRFDAETGWKADDLDGRWVLDAGCGAGRFAEVAAERGARLVAIDLSSAVEAARETLARFPRANVVQASILDPPLRPGALDLAYCIGVVQHTPDPRAAIRGVVGAVKPGGRFAFTIYARRPWTKLYGKYLLRPVTRRLPERVLLGAIEGAMPVLFPLTDRLFRVPVVGKLAQFAIPVATYANDELTDEQRYREAILDTFDMLAPRFDQPMTWGEVEAVLREVGATAWRFNTRAPVNVVGVR